jgi:hypothetical protein
VLPGITLAIVGRVLRLLLVSVVPSLVAVASCEIAGVPAIVRLRLRAVACDTGAAAKTGATASAETAIAPTTALRRKARRFKVDPPGRAPHLRDTWILCAAPRHEVLSHTAHPTSLGSCAPKVDQGCGSQYQQIIFNTDNRADSVNWPSSRFSLPPFWAWTALVSASRPSRPSWPEAQLV